MARELTLRTVCPACGRPAGESRTLFQTLLFGRECPVQRCSCGLVYKGLLPGAGDLQSVYSAGYVHFQDPDAPEGPAEINSARQKLSRCGRLLKGKPPAGGWKLLDVGCGKGQFVSIARQLGYAAEGIDTHLPGSLARGDLHRGSPDELMPASWDIVTLLNVAEHLVDPAPLFKSIRRVLRPEGVLLLTCPYGASLASRVHKERWVHMALDEHLLFWTPQALTAFLRPLGFAGPVSVRIAGSPFPFGRLHRPAGAPQNSRSVVEGRNPAWQAGLWKLARWIQTQEPSANMVRAVVDWTKTGDYLEYAIQQNRAR